MDNDNFSYTFVGESGVEWRIVMESGELTINECIYQRDIDDISYDFAIAMHKVINENH